MYEEYEEDYLYYEVTEYDNDIEEFKRWREEESIVEHQ